MAYSLEFLSASDNGRNIKVVETATPGTTIHTADASAKDEVSLECANLDSVTRTLVLEVGGVTSPDDHIQIDIPPNIGAIPVMAGRVFSNSKVIRAYCATANVLVIGGSVIRKS